jgi:hypothetical protein
MSTFGGNIQHNVSTGRLSQFSGSVIDPYTNYVATVMFKDLVAGPQGQRKINDALSNLPLFFTPDEKLTFGWGPDLLIRNIEAHQGENVEHLAILVALAESCKDP